MNKGQIENLKALAQAAEKDVIRSHGWAGSVEMLETLRIDEEYLTAASPAAILELIALAEKAFQPTSEQNARFAIDGAMWKGHENVDPPPTEDHWLMPYWKMARELAEFKAAAAPSPAVSVEPVLWVESEPCIRDQDARYAINSLCHTVVYHMEKPKTDNPVWPLYATPSPSLAVRDVVESADEKRLDFMATHGAWIAWTKDGETCRVFHRLEDGELAPMEGWGKPFYGTAREAIDAAMLGW